MEEKTLPYVISLSATKPKSITLVPSEPGSRYKTRQLQIQVVGKSKMIRTVFVNVLDVAKDMMVPPAYIVTFIGYCVGAQSKFDPKKPERDQASLSGSHDPKDLSKLMAQFISEVLSCPQCGLPELNLSVDKDDVKGRCRSCGAENVLNLSDPKFKRYIINHPPAQGKAFDGNRTKKEKTEKKEKVSKKKESENGEDENTNDNESEKKEKVSKKKESENGEDKGSNGNEEKASKQKKETENGDNDGVVWYSDTSAEAARKRAEEMLPELAKKKEMTEEIKQIMNPFPSVARLKEWQKKHHATDPEAVDVLFQVSFEPNADLQTCLEAKKSLFIPFTKSNEGQTCLLRNIEQFCGNTNESLLPKSPMILKAFYDADLLEEDIILAWNKKKTASSILEFREKNSTFH